MLLNVSPRADGVINDQQRSILKEIGDWLKIHGEAVYGTHPHTIFGYGTASSGEGLHGSQSSTVNYTGDDIRFTVAKDKKAMYVFFLGRPKAGNKIDFRPIGGYHRNIPPSNIKNITVLGSGVHVIWDLTPETLYITIPEKGLNDVATVFKLELE